MRRWWVVPVLLLTLVPGLARAQMYRWVDERGTVHYAEGLNSVPERYRSTAQPLHFPKAPPAPAAKEGTSPPGATKISFSPGAPILVNAKINGTGPITLILDTGADRTVVAPPVLARLGIPTTAVRRAEMKGVTGTVQVDMVQVNSVEVGEAKAGPLLIAAYDADLKGAEGLLGRDFLDQFKVTIDSTAGVVTLAPK